MNTPKDSTGGCCPPPPCSAFSEASLPRWRKDALGWPIETFKGKFVKSSIRIICQNIRKVIFKPNVNCSPVGATEKAK